MQGTLWDTGQVIIAPKLVCPNHVLVPSTGKSSSSTLTEEIMFLSNSMFECLFAMLGLISAVPHFLAFEHME